MRSKLAMLAVTAAAIAASTPAMAADYLFSFAGTNLFGGQPIIGAGTFSTDDMTVSQNGRDAQKIVGITGTYNGSAITGLNPSIFGADNFYYLMGQFVSGNGLGFDTAAGTSVNLFASVGNYRVNSTNPFQTGFVDASATLVATGAVPEPASWALLIVGFGAIGSALRNRRSALAHFVRS